MRIRTVSIEGFGPFKTRQVVDFRAFDADGLFLIAGETGVGKTSVLDAIAYALYNKTPRWDNVAATGASNSVRSDFCGVDDPTEVILEFETNGHEYRVSRSPEFERPKARGEGTTKQPAKVLIEILEGETWVGKANKEREAAELVHQLLKLNKDEFLQVIMLAQGRFQEFLLAHSEQRLELLSKLFGTGRFADYQKALAERRSALRARVDAMRERATTLLSTVEVPDGIDDQPAPGSEVDWITLVIDHAREEIAVGKAALNAAEKAEAAALQTFDVAKRQRQRESAKAKLATLAEAQAEVDADKERLTRAERAERVRPLIDEAASRFQVWMDAESAVTRARAAYSGTATDAELAASIQTATEEIGRLSDALRDEERAEELARRITATQKEKVALEVQLSKNASSITTLQAQRAELVPLKAQTAPAREKLEQLEGQLEAAQKAVDTARELERARVRQLEADQKLTAARIHADETLRQFLAEQAALLAQNLVPGQPCVVCGSVEHPQPARSAGHPVTDDDLEEAQAEVSRLEPGAAAAKDAVAELTVSAAKLDAASGDADLETLTRLTAAARDALAAAAAAGPRIATIDQQLSGDDGLIAVGDALEASLKQSSDRLTALTTQHETVVAELSRLRGEFRTITARHAALVAERDTAKALLDAIAQLEDAAKQNTAATKKLRAKSKAEGFESSDDVEAALLDDAGVRTISARIEQHAAQISQNEGVLAQPELSDLPDAVITVEQAEADYEEAKRVKQRATVEEANAAATVTALQKTKDELVAALSETAELMAEYEVLNGLTETVNGRTPNTKSMSLESYYIAAELEGVLQAANERFRTLSRGQFEFRHTERGARRANASAGLEIEVFDEYTGSARPANQLSGGSSFSPRSRWHLAWPRSLPAEREVSNSTPCSSTKGSEASRASTSRLRWRRWTRSSRAGEPSA